MTTPPSLASQHCSHQTVQLDVPRLTEELQRLPGWHFADHAISKRFTFADFHQTMTFVNAVAYIAHREDHHPDLTVGYNHCTVRYSTHSVSGVSINDCICAARIEALFT